MDGAGKIDASITRRSTLGLALGAGAMTATAAPPSGWRSVDALGERLIRAKLAPGLSLHVMHHGRTVYARGFGFANLEHRVPVDGAAIFRIGSITKQFTAAAIAALVEDGRVTLDASLAQFLPDFPNSSNISLRQMLNHTSGLGSYTDTASWEEFLQNSRTDYSEQGLIQAALADRSLQRFTPGTGQAYSNTAYLLLGIVIQRITGAPFGDYMRQRLFLPGGLRQTAVDDAAEIVPHRAAGYVAKAGTATGFANASFVSMTYPGAGGALRSTGEDLCRWHHMLLGGRILQPQTLAAMLTPARLGDGRTAAAEGQSAYGLGLGLGEMVGHRMIMNSGGIQGFSIHLRSLPDLGLAIADIANCEGGFGATPLGEALEGIRREILDVARNQHPER